MQPLNLEHELLEHYQKCKQARDTALEAAAFGEGAGAAAGMVNATTTALKELVKMQAELQNIERMKAFERAIVKVLREHQDGRYLLEQIEEEVRYV